MSKFRDYAFDWVAWAFFASIPAVIFWDSATSLERQGVASGGPMQNAAFFPRIVASIMTVLVAWQAVRLLRGRVRQKSPFHKLDGTPLALIVTALFVVYLVLLPYAGFHIATPIMCVVFFMLLGLSPVPAAAGAVALWLSTAFVFEGALNVILPVGVFNIAIF